MKGGIRLKHNVDLARNPPTRSIGMGKDSGSSFRRFVSILRVACERQQAEHDECSELPQQRWALDRQGLNLAEPPRFMA